MSLKRKVTNSVKDNLFLNQKSDINLFEEENEDDEYDSSDEETCSLEGDSDFVEGDHNDSDEWEDISVDGFDDEVKEKFEIDSDYIGSAKEDTDREYGGKIGKNSITKGKKKKLLLKKKDKIKNEIVKQLEPATSTAQECSKLTSENSVNGTKCDEYEEDSSDEEDLRNTIGNVPINWYDDYDHLGYGLDSLPIRKPIKGDTLDKFLEKLENPDYGRTVIDKQTGQDVRLSDAHVDLVNRLLSAKVPDAKYDFYKPFPDLYSHEVSEMPLSGRMNHKRSFLPSKHERKRVAVLASLIRRGIYKKRKIKQQKRYYDLWKKRDADDPKIRGVTAHIPPPKVLLPEHGDSYNPPPEYLIQPVGGKSDKPNLNEKMLRGFWRKFKSVREIPMYHNTLKGTYERLRDLYDAPRKQYKKIIGEAKDFLPKLPDKKDLRPYPTMEGLVFKGHQSIIRTISMHPCGKYLASGSDDHTVRIWEVSTGRCLRTFEMDNVVKRVSWNPHDKLFLLGIACGTKIILLNPETYLTDKLVVKQTNAIFKEEVDQGDYITPEKVKDAVTWRKPTEQEWQNGYRIVIDHFSEVKEIVWHRQGDFFASVIPTGCNRSVFIHQLSRWRSQIPLKKNKGLVQAVKFHPKLPQLFVATQAHIRVYNLKTQRLLKKIQANSRYISCLAVHPGGEHFIIGGYDRKVNWFEMECTKRPHLMRYHVSSVRNISFHRKYPLYASCSDDPQVIVAHATVYDDYLKDPLIVPIKQLRRHKKFEDYYVLDVTWHPYEPFLFTAGADATIRLWH